MNNANYAEKIASENPVKSTSMCNV